MEPPWEKGPERIEQLLGARTEARELLVFYQSLLVFQKSLFALLEEAEPSGSFTRDLPRLMNSFVGFLNGIAVNGSTLLRSQAQEMKYWEADRQAGLLAAYWRHEEIPGGNFFPKAFLQPYATHLAQHGIAIQDRDDSRAGCPFCGAPPQLSFLQSPPSIAGIGSEGAGRRLLCSLCFSDWPINRICCANCSEANPDQLSYFQSERLPAMRIEACDSCLRYLKGVNLTKDGLAVPLVDELATPALDIWARENGYQKIELNLAGI